MTALSAIIDPIVADPRARLSSLQHRLRVLDGEGYSPSPSPSSLQTAEANVRRRLATLASHSSNPVGFLQHFHLARRLLAADTLHDHYQATIETFLRVVALLASTAAELLDVRQVRLYQDCVFVKEPGHAETNWHSDLRMTPLDTNDFVTVWVPLTTIPAGLAGSGLLFAEGSHRDFALPFWYKDAGTGKDLHGRYRQASAGRMVPGDATFHHGWVLHAAGGWPAEASAPRVAYTVSFFAEGTRTLPQSDQLRRGATHDEDQESYAEWFPGRVLPGQLARDDLYLPIFGRRRTEKRGREGVGERENREGRGERDREKRGGGARRGGGRERKMG